MQIVSALNLRCKADDFTAILMDVWFEEYDGPLPFVATLFDCEPHGRELWFRAMKGEYGEIEIIFPPSPESESLRMLTHDR